MVLGCCNPQTKETEWIRRWKSDEYRSAGFFEEGVAVLTSMPVPDGEQWYVEFVNFRSGEVTEMVREIKSSAPGNLAMSPDGQWILVEELGERNYDIMLVENFQ